MNLLYKFQSKIAYMVPCPALLSDNDEGQGRAAILHSFIVQDDIGVGKREFGFYKQLKNYASRGYP